MNNKAMERKYAYTTTEGVYVQCNDCGAMALSADRVRHFPTCKPTPPNIGTMVEVEVEVTAVTDTIRTDIRNKHVSVGASRIVTKADSGMLYIFMAGLLTACDFNVGERIVLCGRVEKTFYTPPQALLGSVTYRRIK